jgi:glycosyltransferase involved in cell wall biosynthesis
MKIGIVIFTDDAQIGGGITYIQQILQGLMKKAAASRHTFCLIGRGELKPAYLDDIDLRWVTLRREELAEPPASDAEYYPEINREDFDLLCYLHPWSHWVCPIRDIPYFSNVWDLQHRLQPFFPEVTSFGEFDRREGMYRRALQRAACIIASNEVGKQEIVTFFQVAPERVHAIEHPTPAFALEADLSSDPDTLPRLGIDRGYLFYPAQFWPHKNHILLLLMLQQLQKEHGEDLKLVLTGSDRGNLVYIRQKIGELGLEERVVFVGFVSQPDLITLYRKAVALVFPSFFGPENFPPLEAFALGCPVIASNVAGAQEQMGDAALLVDPTKPELWSRAVARLRRDRRLRRSLVAKGKKRALKFTREDFAKELLHLFDEFACYRRTWPSSEDKIKFVAL